jgi:hypothetical protein
VDEAPGNLEVDPLSSRPGGHEYATLRLLPETLNFSLPFSGPLPAYDEGDAVCTQLALDSRAKSVDGLNWLCEHNELLRWRLAKPLEDWLEFAPKRVRPNELESDFEDMWKLRSMVLKHLVGFFLRRRLTIHHAPFEVVQRLVNRASTIRSQSRQRISE